MVPNHEHDRRARALHDAALAVHRAAVNACSDSGTADEHGRTSAAHHRLAAAARAYLAVYDRHTRNTR